MPVRGRTISLDRLSDVTLTNPTNGQVIKYDSASGEWVNDNESGGGGGSGKLVEISVNQTGHSFSVQNAIYFDGTDWQLAQADSAATVGTAIVTQVADSNNFNLCIAGEVDGLSGLTSGAWYFVSDATAGLLTTTESGINSNPIMFATSTTTAIVMPLRASTVDTSTVGSTERLKWVDLLHSWTVEPAVQTYTGGDGSVLAYTYGATTYYRFIPATYNPAQDQFFTTFSDPTLSGLVATRGSSI